MHTPQVRAKSYISTKTQILGIIRLMNVNGELDKEVDVQNIRFNFVGVDIVDVNTFHRY